MHYKAYLASLPAFRTARIPQPEVPPARMAANENPLGPSPRAMEALQAAIAEVHRYPDPAAWKLRDVLAERVGLTSEEVICSNGSDELIMLICGAFLREQDEVVIANATFISYLMRTIQMGASAVRVPLRADYGHDLEAMLAAITPRTRIIFVCNPNNPTGTTQGEAEIRAFLERVPDDVLVVMDEAYIEFVSRPDYPDLIADLRGGRGNLLLMRTFAKIYGLAGLRLGYAYGAAPLIEYLDKARPVFNVSVLAQAAGIAALGDDEHVARSRAYAEASRAYLSEALARVGLMVLPSETNFITVRVNDDMAMAGKLRERGFVITPLSMWGLPGFVRISFGSEDENRRLVEAFETIGG